MTLGTQFVVISFVSSSSTSSHDHSDVTITTINRYVDPILGDLFSMGAPLTPFLFLLNISFAVPTPTSQMPILPSVETDGIGIR